MVSGTAELPVRVLVLQGEQARRESIEAGLKAQGCELVALDTAMVALDGASRGAPAAAPVASVMDEPPRREGDEPWSGLPYAKAREQALREFERAYLTVQLRACKDNISAAARRAGMDRSNFKRLLRKHRHALQPPAPIDDDLAIG